VNKFLGRYFDERDVLSFRSLQAQTGALISGSSALQVLDQTEYPESDLDVYVDLYETLKICEWLVAREYVFEPYIWQTEGFAAAIDGAVRTAVSEPGSWAGTDQSTSEYSGSGIGVVLSFSKSISEAVKRKVQVIGARNTAIQAILLFHSSTFVKTLAVTSNLTFR
jgi:hypothetical protein